MILRLLLLLAVLALGAVAATLVTERFTLSGGGSEEEDGDLLPLPPVEETRPLSEQPAAPIPPLKVPTQPSVARALPPEASQGPAGEAAATGDPQPPSTTEDTEEKAPAGPPPVETRTAGTEAPAAPDEAAAQTGPESPPAAPALTWKKHRIRPGDSLARVFRELELPAALLHRIVNSSDAAGGLARVKPGQELRFGFDGEGRLQELVLQRDRIRSLHVRRDGEGFSAEEVQLPLDRRIASVQGTILSSLFADGQKAGLSDSQIMELANIFGWDIDFALELREGDRFSVIFEEHYLDGEKLGNGPILAAEFVNRGTVYRAVRYTDSKGETAYYDPEGNAKRRAFIRTPVEFGRISSGFTRKRWHPVLKRWRSHKGVDYAAPTGTPVKATGNGTVTFIGRKGGYGKVIFLRHGGRYTTVYGHLSRFARGLKTGSKVKQGQVIGYVGSTGLATGPHLHYEFRINGVHRNPLTVKLPRSIRLPEEEMARFRRTIEPMVARLDNLRARSMVASAADTATP